LLLIKKLRTSSLSISLLINIDDDSEFRIVINKVNRTIVITINKAIGNHFLDKSNPKIEIGALFFL
jgi:hypothetical protein